jgi:hypothetical protein
MVMDDNGNPDKEYCQQYRTNNHPIQECYSLILSLFAQIVSSHGFLNSAFPQKNA